MAYKIPSIESALLAQTQASCLPDLVWTYEATSSAFTESKLMYRTFRAWNFAQKHGFQLKGVLYEGGALEASEVAAINLWLQGGGAMAAQNLSHWDAVRLFETIRKG